MQIVPVETRQERLEERNRMNDQLEPMPTKSNVYIAPSGDIERLKDDGKLDWSHDGCLGRTGELRGHLEQTNATDVTAGGETLVSDARDNISPNQAVEKKFEDLMDTMRNADTGP